MQAIIDFFTSIWGVIQSVLDFLFGIIQDLIYIVELTAKFLAQIPTYFSFLPGRLVAMVVIIFGIVVVYKILGREG